MLVVLFLLTAINNTFDLNIVFNLCKNFILLPQLGNLQKTKFCDIGKKKIGSGSDTDLTFFDAKTTQNNAGEAFYAPQQGWDRI